MIDLKPGYGRFRGRIVKGSETHKELKRNRLLANLRPARAGLSEELRNWRLYRTLSQPLAGRMFGVDGACISVWERDGVPKSCVREVRDRLEGDAAFYGVSFKDRRYKREPYVAAQTAP